MEGDKSARSIETSNMVDFSLYLVTDTSPEIIGGRDLEEVVEAAIRGGVTIVQYRNKLGDTAELLQEASALLRITREHKVPLIINDRVDIALAVGADGVHIGQDDLDLETVKQILASRPNAIIGVSVSNAREAIEATSNGATYLGIGSVFGTPTKTDTKSIIGPAGVRDILDELRKAQLKIPCVCIGGINASNIQRVIFSSGIMYERRLAGVAVVSAIMASPDPQLAAQNLHSLMNSPPPFEAATPLKEKHIGVLGYDVITVAAPGYIRNVWHIKPLCHNMTNTVVSTMAANMAIAVGGSPIMSSDGNEAADLAALNGSLVINMGTVTPDNLQNYIQAIEAYNRAGRPILLDPVGAGATRVRRNALRKLLSAGYFTVIKGNESEIKTIVGLYSEDDIAMQRGVDSGESTMTHTERSELTIGLARREKCIVLMTGEVDHLSDGRRHVSIGNGHPYMGLVTGSGCCLGTIIGAFLAIVNENSDDDGDMGKYECEDKLMAVLAAALLYEISAEVAAQNAMVQGPGTFVPAWLDQLFLLSSVCTESAAPDWIRKAKCMPHFLT